MLISLEKSGKIDERHDYIAGSGNWNQARLGAQLPSRASYLQHFNNRIRTDIKPEAGQADKGTWWMPWHQGPKKGVASLR